MIKKINILRIGLMSAGIFFALVAVVSVNTNKAHAAVVLDPTSTYMLVNVISATGGVMNSVQSGINTGNFNPAESAGLSVTLGGISNVLAVIRSMIGSSAVLGASFPNAGFPPHVW
jgi:hypothetical protein